MSLLPKDKDLDWKAIWQKQNLFPVLAKELLAIAYCSHIYLMDQAGGGLVRTISRNVGTWTGFQKVKYVLSDEFVASLISLNETKTIEAAAKRAHRFNSDIDQSVEIFKLGENYWRRIYTALKKDDLLSSGDLSFINSIANYIGKNSLPTSAQCKRLVKIVIKAEDKGFIMPNE